MKNPFGTIKQLWQKVTARSGFQSEVDIVWEQQNYGQVAAKESPARMSTEPFVNHDLPLAAGLQEVERRLEEWRKLEPLNRKRKGKKQVKA